MCVCGQKESYRGPEITPKEGLLHYNLITIIMYFFCAWYQYNIYVPHRANKRVGSP